VGNLTADAMRTAYNVDFAITNAGGLRADLTCPTTDNATDFCPASLYPFPAGLFPITRGQVLTVLPFGNVVVTMTVNGAELKTMLENGVSQMPAANGRFPQVSGLCLTYNISAPAGSRLLGAVRQAADGSCTGAAVDLTAGSTYTLAENDFMANGGDGYPNFVSRMTTQNIMDGAGRLHRRPYVVGHRGEAPASGWAVLWLPRDVLRAERQLRRNRRGLPRGPTGRPSLTGDVRHFAVVAPDCGFRLSNLPGSSELPGR
jgi:hypothetical protein